MYVGNGFEQDGTSREVSKREYEEVPAGVSALKWKDEMVPRKRTEWNANVEWWTEHGRGGPFRGV